MNSGGETTVKLEMAADVRQMVVSPGAVLVVTLRRQLTMEQTRVIAKQLGSIWPDNKVVILAAGLELSMTTDQSDSA